jgi:addiction module RelE/StbE family toxin
MKIRHSRLFKKQFKKLSPKLQLQFDERYELWCLNPKHPLLNVHPLFGDKFGYWSINISGDLRVLYCYEDDTIVFSAIGTHSQLY